MKTGAELARLEIASVNAAMTDWSHSSEVSVTRSGNAVYRRPRSVDSASATVVDAISPVPRMLPSMSVPSLQLKDQLVQLVDYDMIAAELSMPRSLVEATAASLESRAPYDNDERAMVGQVLDSSNRRVETRSGAAQPVPTGGFVDRWEPELARRRAQRAADQQAANERWQAAAGPGSLHRAEVNVFRKTKLGLSGKLHGWREQFQKEARWIASRKVMEDAAVDNPETRWARIDEENMPRLPAWYHSPQQRSFRDSRQMQLDDANAAAEQAKLESDASKSRRRVCIEEQRASGVDDSAPGQSLVGASRPSAAGAADQENRSTERAHPTVDVNGEWEAGAPTPEVVIAQHTRAMQEISPQDEHRCEAEQPNPLNRQLGGDGVAGVVNIHGAPLPRFAGHHPVARVDQMRTRVDFLFKQVDTDSDGALTREELHRTLSKEGEIQKELVQLIHTSGRHLHEIFEQLDTDSDHKITTTEFLALIDSTPLHPMAGAVDWENMDPMTGKPLASDVQKPTPVSMDRPSVMPTGPSTSTQSAMKSESGEHDVPRIHEKIEDPPQERAPRRKRLGLRQVQTTEPASQASATSIHHTPELADLAGTSADAEGAAAEEQGAEWEQHPLEIETVAGVAESFTKEIIAHGVEQVVSPKKHSTQGKTKAMKQGQGEQRPHAAETVAIVAESYTKALVAKGIEQALAAWPEEFTAATHPEQWSVFSSMDADGSGTLDSEELFSALVRVVASLASPLYARTVLQPPTPCRCCHAVR